MATHDAYMNMAIDEAVARNCAAGRTPNTVRFFRWKPSAVSLGFFQSVTDEVNVAECRKRSVDIVRRITGGGAVYHDYEGEVTYSIITNLKEQKIPQDIPTCYETLCGALVNGLRKLNLKASFQPVNDIIVSGKKISGNAQTRRMGVMLQHGTVLVDLNLSTMFSLLKVGKEKIKDKLIKSAEERVTSVRRELGRKVSLKEVADALWRGLEETLDIKLILGRLTSEELNLAEKIREEKYSTKEWIFQR